MEFKITVQPEHIDCAYRAMRAAMLEILKEYPDNNTPVVLALIADLSWRSAENLGIDRERFLERIGAIVQHLDNTRGWAAGGEDLSVDKEFLA